jgi:hypothetical protein
MPSVTPTAYPELVRFERSLTGTTSPAFTPKLYAGLLEVCAAARDVQPARVTETTATARDRAARDRRIE